MSLFDKIATRVPAIVSNLLEQYRVSALAKAPDSVKFMFEGAGWEIAKRDPERLERFTRTAWSMAFCEIIEVLMESDFDLEKRITELENK